MWILCIPLTACFQTQIAYGIVGLFTSLSKMWLLGPGDDGLVGKRCLIPRVRMWKEKTESCHRCALS